MTDRAGEARLPRTDAEVAERDVAALAEKLAHAEQRVAGLEDAIRHVSVTSSRYRSHAEGCQATCTCGAVEDDKIVKNEIGRVVQRALTPPPPAQENPGPHPLDGFTPNLQR